MEDPSTIRRAVADIGRAPYGGDSLAGQTGKQGGDDRGNNVPYLFLVRNMFFFPKSHCHDLTIPVLNHGTDNHNPLYAPLGEQLTHT
jgi:hypothetical protein